MPKIQAGIGSLKKTNHNVDYSKDTVEEIWSFIRIDNELEQAKEKINFFLFLYNLSYLVFSFFNKKKKFARINNNNKHIYTRIGFIHIYGIYVYYVL